MKPTVTLPVDSSVGTEPESLIDMHHPRLVAAPETNDGFGAVRHGALNLPADCDQCVEYPAGVGGCRRELRGCDENGREADNAFRMVALFV